MDVAHAFRLQADACEKMRSDLYARLLKVAAADLEDEGPVFRVVDHWDRNPMDDAVPLRLLGGVHRIVLSGRAPELARHYPSVGGSPEWPACGHDFLSTVADHVPELRIGMLHPPQTNEVGRSGVLVGGLLEASRLTGGMPIRLLEYGASGGLNLRLDHYRYEFDVAAWGDPDSPFVIETPWRGASPEVDRMLDITDRRGCDAAPLDVTDDLHARRLESFVWPDQTDRLQRTRSAIRIVREHPVTIDTASADHWLAEHLAAPASGQVTVVMHSAVTQYLDKTVRARMESVLARQGRHADRRAPLVRLSLEPGQKYFALRLRIWPGNIDVILADAHPHGAWANWFIGTGSP